MSYKTFMARTTLFFFVLVPFAHANDAFLLPLPIGVTIESSDVVENERYSLLLSTPKKINNVLRIEKEKLLYSKRNNFLLRADRPADHLSVFNELARFIDANGELLYRCEERACGSSNLWANTILEERKLYGRDSEQYYLAGRVKLKDDYYYAAVYSVKNARRQEYVYVSLLADGQSGKRDDSSEESVSSGLFNGLVLSHHALSNKLLTQVNRYLDESESTSIILVSEYQVSLGGSEIAAKAVAERKLSDFKRKFVSNNKLPDARIETRVQLASPAVQNISNGQGIAPPSNHIRLYLLAP